MMNNKLRKIAHTVSGKYSKEGNDKYLAFFLFFFFGMFLGSNASSHIFADLYFSLTFSKLALDYSMIAVILFFSTSFIGFILIPVVVAFRGFVFSAMLSSIWFSDAGGFLNALTIEAFPVLFFLPCFFIIASDSTMLSIKLFRNNSIHPELNRNHFVKHILYCTPLFLSEIFYCLYLLPLLVR